MMWTGGWWWLALPLMMILCMAMMGRMMGHGHGHGSHAVRGAGASGQGAPAERILGERLARGEIDIEEYERRMAVLQRTSEGARAQGGAPDVG